MAIMCQGTLEKDSVEIAHLIDFNCCFESEPAALDSLENKGQVELRHRSICVTSDSRRKVFRLIAGTFDRYFNVQKLRNKFSRVL